MGRLNCLLHADTHLQIDATLGSLLYTAQKSIILKSSLSELEELVDVGVLNGRDIFGKLPTIYNDRVRDEFFDREGGALLLSSEPDGAFSTTHLDAIHANLKNRLRRSLVNRIFLKYFLKLREYFGHVRLMLNVAHVRAEYELVIPILVHGLK